MRKRIICSLTIIVLMHCVVYLLSAQSPTISSTGIKGNWSGDSTWMDLNDMSNRLPSPTDIVEISAGDTVTIDTSTTISGLIIGQFGGSYYSRLKLSTSKNLVITINGDLIIADSCKLVAEKSTIGNHIIDTLIITGNIMSSGYFATRLSSSSIVTALNVIFTGSGNSIVDIKGPIYTSSPYNNVWCGFVVQKSGSGRVILNSDVVLPGGSSGQPNNIHPTIYLNRGIIQTGNHAIIAIWTIGSDPDNSRWVLVGGSDSSYVLGNLGLGISNGSAATRWFPVGDEDGFRPVTIHNTTPGNGTGHHVIVGCIRGDANTGSSTFDPAIDKVSAIRYYKVTYHKQVSTQQAGGDSSMSFDRFTLSYDANDGVTAGNTNLRIGESETREIWTSSGPTDDTTKLTYQSPTEQASNPGVTSVPPYIKSDSMNVTIRTDSSFYLALARVTGTTENSLDTVQTFIQREYLSPSRFALEQNYPNPFNPSTEIRFHLDKISMTSLRVYDILGREVATLIESRLGPGTYSTKWNANGFASGMYLLRLQSNEQTMTHKILLMK